MTNDLDVVADDLRFITEHLPQLHTAKVKIVPSYTDRIATEIESEPFHFPFRLTSLHCHLGDLEGDGSKRVSESLLKLPLLTELKITGMDVDQFQAKSLLFLTQLRSLTLHSDICNKIDLWPMELQTVIATLPLHTIDLGQEEMLASMFDWSILSGESVLFRHLRCWKLSLSTVVDAEFMCQLADRGLPVNEIVCSYEGDTLDSLSALVQISPKQLKFSNLSNERAFIVDSFRILGRMTQLESLRLFHVLPDESTPNSFISMMSQLSLLRELALYEYPVPSLAFLHDTPKMEILYFDDCWKLPFEHCAQYLPLAKNLRRLTMEMIKSPGELRCYGAITFFASLLPVDQLESIDLQGTLHEGSLSRWRIESVPALKAAAEKADETKQKHENDPPIKDLTREGIEPNPGPNAPFQELFTDGILSIHESYMKNELNFENRLRN